MGINMKKEAFLHELRSHLQGAVSKAELQEHLQYYRTYITEAVQNGQTEDDVLAELGSPSLLAKSIVEVSANGEKETRGSANDTGAHSFGAKNQASNPWYRRIIVIAVILFFLSFILRMVGFVIQAFLPIILPLILVILVVSMFQNSGRK